MGAKPRLCKDCMVCPFCGADIGGVGDDKPKVYDNSRDALTHIAQAYGADVLLGGALKSYLMDFAPMIETKRKNVILSVSASASALLKKGLSATAEEQERIYKQAVQKVADDYGTERSLAESVMLEFADALGWKIRVQTRADEENAKRQELAAQQWKLESERAELERQRAELQKWETELANRQKSAAAPPVQPSGTGALRVGQRHLVGQRDFSFGPYKWRVLDAQNGRALLLAENILENRTYHGSSPYCIIGITWENCDLRKYLNGDFLRKFSGSEQGRIAEVANSNPDNPWYGTAGGSSTRDKVFLLSIYETVKYLGDSGDMRAKKRKDKCFIDDQYNNARKADYGNKDGRQWWLRSPGDKDICAAVVLSDGCIYLNGYPANIGFGGVRPALWLNL